MSRFIGKRVFYSCYNCGNYLTIDKKTIEIEDGVLCKVCSKKWEEVNEKIKSELIPHKDKL